MALNAANFDMKLKQIKFSPDVKDEDRELVATMAQFNKGGVAEVKIREMKKNEKGEDEADTVGVCSLRVEHVELLDDN
jgi:DNA topoisomerase IB